MQTLPDFVENFFFLVCVIDVGKLFFISVEYSWKIDILPIKEITTHSRNSNCLILKLGLDCTLALMAFGRK